MHEAIILHAILYARGNRSPKSREEHRVRVSEKRVLGKIFGLLNKAYLKVKIEELETNFKIKNIRDLYRDINVFKKVSSLELL